MPLPFPGNNIGLGIKDTDPEVRDSYRYADT